MTLYAGTDSVVQLVGLTDADGLTVATAAVTATLYRGDAELWTGTLLHVGSGTYEAAVPDTVGVVEGEVVRWRVEATAGELDALYEWRERVQVRGA